jgi:hypothetical protein
VSEVESDAILSECGRYRYLLRRWWNPAVVPLVFVMLNPSTADATMDDPTIRRCMGFAKRDGYGGILVGNLYAYRATKPADLWKTEDPVGPDNDVYLRRLASSARVHDMPVVAAWGASARPERVERVLGIESMREVLCSFGVTKAGHPRHPLYLPGNSVLSPWGMPG